MLVYERSRNSTVPKSPNGSKSSSLVFPRRIVKTHRDIPHVGGLNGAGHARALQRQRATLTGVEGKKTVRTRAHGPPTPSSLHSVDLPFPSYLRLSRSRCAIEPCRWNVCKHGSIHGVFLCFVHGHGLLLLILSFPAPSVRRADKARVVQGCARQSRRLSPAMGMRSTKIVKRRGNRLTIGVRVTA